MTGELTYSIRVPNIIAASIAISVFGFFSGPLFAAVSPCYRICHQPRLQTNSSPGNVSRIKIVHIRDQIDRAIFSLRLRTDGRFRLPNRHRTAEYQHWSMGPAAYPGVTDRGDHGVLVHRAEAQRLGER